MSIGLHGLSAWDAAAFVVMYFVLAIAAVLLLRWYDSHKS